MILENNNKYRIINWFVVYETTNLIKEYLEILVLRSMAKKI